MSVEFLEFMINNDFKTRPNADCGLWVLFLLPLSIIISTIKHPVILTPTYKLVSILSVGLLFTSLIISYQKFKNQKLKIITIWSLTVLLITATVFHVCLHKDWLFALLSGVTSTFVYYKICFFILNKFKECFTLGEAGLISQSMIILLYCTVINVANASSVTYKSNMQISTLIIQIGLLGVGTIAWSAYIFNIETKKPFYILTVIVLIFVILLPLHVLLQTSPVIWILNQIFSDLPTLKLIIYWSFCSGIAVLAVSNQIFYAQKASTGLRKIFHILAVIVYIPGLLYRCSFLYLASGVVIGIFFSLEILRLLNIPPLGLYLQDGFVVFSDEKDVGNLALTPIYLMAGCSLPIWIHPSPCDLTDSAMFNLLPLLSGLLSVGLGDTAASIVGSNFGKHYWPGSKKTVEGTAACILAQISLLYLLIYFDFLARVTTKNVQIYLSVLVTSFVEAKTTQCDNLVLPLIMYIILI